MVHSLMLTVALFFGQVETQDEASTSLPSTPVEAPESAPPPDRWLIMNALQGTQPGQLLDRSRINICGWTDCSYTTSSAAQRNLPLGFNYRANEFLMQQNWLRVERPVITTGTTDPSFGFRSDTILPGTDYRFTLARGLFDGQLTADDGQPNMYGIDPLQFYGEAYFPTIGRGLDVKLGRILCVFGAEYVATVNTSLPSHSYNFIYNPYTQTGAIATQQLTPEWSVQYGAALGPDVFIDSASSPYGVFSLIWAPPGGSDTVYASTLIGCGRYDVDEQFNNPNVFDIVYTHIFDPVWQYTLDAALGYQTNVPGIGTATWYGFANYLTCKVAPTLTHTTRLEFFDDVDGNRTGYPGLYTALTLGLAFQPKSSLLIRPELRFDVNDESKPFEDKRGLLTAAFDLITRW